MQSSSQDTNHNTRSVEPLLEQPQGTVSTHMTAGLMGPLQQRWDSVTRHHNTVLVPEVALVPLPLVLVDQEGFKAFLQELVDIPELLQVLRLLESIQGAYHRHVEIQVDELDLAPSSTTAK